MYYSIFKSKEIIFFVSIGCGLNQLPLIHEAKKLGFHVIGVDINPTAPGFMECDLKIQESVENYNEIFTKLEELLIDGKIKGIMTKSYGKAIVTASHLNNKFNIPNIPIKSSEIFIDKKKMKAAFKSAGINTPKYMKFSGDHRKIESSLYPFIIKPEQGHAKSGVSLIENNRELKKYLSISPKTTGYMIEKYIEGDEIIAAGIIHAGKFYLAEITDKVTTNLPYFVDLMHISPSLHMRRWAEVQEIGSKLAETFGIDNSPLIMEIIIDRDGNLHLIESVPEFGGEFIPEIMIPGATGYNFISECIRSLCGLGFNQPPLKKRKQSLVIKFITGDEEGRLVSLNPDSPKRMKELVFSRIFKSIGDNIRKPQNNHDRIGVVAVLAGNRDEAMAAADAAASSYDIKIRP